MIKVTKLTCIDENDKSVITDASFTIADDDRVVILSDSNEHSTLLCHALAGIINRTHPAYRVEGMVLYRNQPIEEMESNERSKTISYVPSNSDLLISGVKDTVFGEIALSLELSGTRPHIIREKVAGILQKLSIGSLGDRNPDQLSGGERHKVALASMLVREPDILILDNPSLFLDASGVSNLLHIIRAYHGTVIVADPNPYLWAPIVHRFIVIKNSEVIIFRTSSEFIQSIVENRLHSDLPAWTELYLRLRNHIRFDTQIHPINSLTALRTIARGIK
jgi:energy-coupling factor transport system ATP-binding protein